MNDPCFNVDLYSHHFTLTRVTPAGRALINTFVRNYMQFGLVKVNRKFVRAPVKVFGTKLANHTEYAFHIQQWGEFVSHLGRNGMTSSHYVVNLIEPDPGQDIEISTLPGWTERDYQIPIGEYLVSDKPSKIKMLEIQTGRGKALCNDAKVKIPGGWKRMGDVELGDVVISPDGTPTNVIGVYPQGEVECCEVVFGDGRSVVASLDHLWTVDVHSDGGHFQKKVVPSAAIHDLIENGSHVSVVLIDSEQSPFVILPADPYVIGETFMDPDTEFDPSQIEFVFQGSHLQRLHFVQGVMDRMAGEGASIYDDARIDIRTPDHQRATLFQYLVRSLGGICSVGPDPFDDDLWLLEITHQTPSHLAREPAVKAWLSRLDKAEPLRLSVRQVIPVGPKPAVCISVDNPSQEFVTENFIATHNTFCALKAAARLGKRIAVIIKPGFIEKWAGSDPGAKVKVVGDFEKICGIPREEIAVVQGSLSLMKLMARAEAGEEIEKVIVFSNRTLQNFFSLYEERGKEILDMGYAFKPRELFPKLKVGLRLIDEVHMDFHLNFKIDLYTNVAHSISLSATLKNDDAFLNRMYELAYPKNERYAGLAYDKYAVSYSWTYRTKRPDQLRTMEYGSTTYSHNVFEKSLMRQPGVLQMFFEMIVKIINRFYLGDDYRKGDRVLIYFASIDMCTRFTEYLKQVFKDKDVRRYVEDDPYENLMDPDICVSTLLSAGTGHDIAQLTTVILTTSIMSYQSNVQGFGRLRKIPGRTVRFVYLTCEDVPKQVEYHLKKKELLKTISADYNSISYSQTLE